MPRFPVIPPHLIGQLRRWFAPRLTLAVWLLLQIIVAAVSWGIWKIPPSPIDWLVLLRSCVDLWRGKQ